MLCQHELNVTLVLPIYYLNVIGSVNPWSLMFIGLL
jgi:hypothetical protein